MERIAQRYQTECCPSCDESAIVQGAKYRFTVLTSQLIRMEYSENGNFEDRATQAVLNRNFSVPQFSVINAKDSLELITEHLHLYYNKQKFSKNGLSVQVKGNLSHYLSHWHYGDISRNLMGTARTLDRANGAIPLENGLLSKVGFAVMDDSRSLILAQDGWVEPRAAATDLYFFGYGHEYLHCLKDFYRLCGSTPMLPRYALGNWWSRYYRYTEHDYLQLMERFEKEQIPFSVAVLDMDWHLTDIPEKYGSGWTGYTWNKELFPHPAAFLNRLHEKGLKVTLNLHPAEGVRAFEEAYEPMAKALGIATENEEKISFDCSDPKFMEAYFTYLHHPREKEGVDFWWIDWQQGTSTKIEGLDPLWMLNHYHFADRKQTGHRPLIFSRYAGIGSHRYPVGFSGDTHMTWASLDFQPYFTATASNIGYGWWSHDIGGHMLGRKDDELATRWVQFGVFSPIMRLHSSCSPFNGKEPWRYNLIAETAIKSYLRLRHKLIPYLYTMNHSFYKDGLPLIQPMYYHHAQDEAAYCVPNQYYFGSELIVCPITQPMNQSLGVAKVQAWLPKGNWIDIFNGRIYKGNRAISLYRSLNNIPVFAKAGTILPLADTADNSVENPKEMEIHLFAGANNNFSLYEDDGDNLDYDSSRHAVTNMSLVCGKSVNFTLAAAQGDTSSVPKVRTYSFKFRCFADCEQIVVLSGGQPIPFQKQYDAQSCTLTLLVKSCPTNADLTVQLINGNQIAASDRTAEVFSFLNQAQIEFTLKDKIFNLVNDQPDFAFLFCSLQSLNLDADLLGVLCELLLC